MPPRAGGRRRGRARPRARARHRARRRRARGAARRGARRRAPVGRDPGLRPVPGGGRDRGLEDLRQGDHGGGGRADGGDARRAGRAVRAQGGRPRRGQGRRRLPDAGRGRGGARRARRPRRPARGRGAARRARDLGLRDLRRRHGACAAGGAGLQAIAGRRPRPEHRRHGLVRAGSRLRRRRASSGSSTSPAARSSPSSRPAGIRSSGRSSRA